MSDKVWKVFERTVCRKFFGAERAGPVGRTGPDCKSDFWAVECRQRSTISYSDLEEWSKEVRRESGGRMPVLVVRRIVGAGQPAPTLFIMDEQGWLDLHGPTTAQEVPPQPKEVPMVSPHISKVNRGF